MLSASAGTGSDESTAVISVQNVGTKDVPVNEPIEVKVDEGRLTSVSVTGGMGSIPGEMAADGRSWASQEGLQLPFGTTYQISAVAVDGEGRTKAINDSFTTIAPQEQVNPAVLYMADYDTYGVGMPIMVNFNVPVTEKKAVEERLSVTSTIPLEGAWSWNEANTRVTFRPNGFWPSGTSVSFTSSLYGVKLNDVAYGASNPSINFNVGDKVVMDVDVNTYQMTVSKNDVPLKTIPVTIGKAGFETHEGVKVITGKEGTITMRSAPGSTDPYVAENVQFSMRLTEHGEYLHAAPWANSAFGNYANSHGCISMTTDNAGWLWSQTNEGDVITTFGTGFPWQQDNGVTAWNYSWEQWLSRSATGPMLVGPEGATPVVA
jgi:lipoprotein-anchoring transpeptidase ErfK/SrfK